MGTLDDRSTCVEKNVKKKSWGILMVNVWVKANAYISSSTKRIFLFSASMAFISSLVREKSNIWQNREKVSYLCIMYVCVCVCMCLTCNPTWKLCLILSGLKLLGMTTTPLCTLKRSATWALLLLYFLPIDTRSSSSSRGGHFRFTLKHRQKTAHWKHNWVGDRLDRTRTPGFPLL